MFKKEEVSSAQENAQAKHELKEGECGVAVHLKT